MKSFMSKRFINKLSLLLTFSNKPSKILFVRGAREKGMDILEEIKRLDAVAFGELCRRAANEDNLGARLVEGISIEIMATDGGLIEEQMSYTGEF
jgi:hypothetical protein|tara:strand:+ start:148 stop:432 length:285 start_codon:yes stop_codon:yes gene_type:complete